MQSKWLSSINHTILSKTIAIFKYPLLSPQLINDVQQCVQTELIDIKKVIQNYIVTRTFNEYGKWKIMTYESYMFEKSMML